LSLNKANGGFLESFQLLNSTISSLLLICSLKIGNLPEHKSLD
jgi:hypothetical protein